MEWRQGLSLNGAKSRWFGVERGKGCSLSPLLLNIYVMEWWRNWKELAEGLS